MRKKYNLVYQRFCKWNVRPNMVQEIIGLLQKLNEETPDIQDIALVNTIVTGRIEVFCKHPATFPPDISIGKHAEEKSPAGSLALSVLLSSKHIQRTYNSWSMVKCGLIEQQKFSSNSPEKLEQVLELTCRSRYRIFYQGGRRRLRTNLK